MNGARKGTTLIDLLMSIAIIALLFGGIYLVYFSIETALSSVTVRTAATAAIQNEMEMVRNLPYADVGTVNGIPAGVVPQTQSVVQGGYTFTLQTAVLDIDDPYDSSPSSSPVTDYKLVDITASCPLCQNFAPVEITTTVAPSLLTAGTAYGAIFVNVIDANGLAVGTATVEVVNASVTPSIDLTDTTNASGTLKLIGVPTSTQGYAIYVSKPGYSSAQTYAATASNPHPILPDITAASESVSNVTLAIDRLSALTVATEDDRCAMVGSEPFTITGSKLIGTDPDIIKFATSSATGADGTIAFANMEWDTYALALSDAADDVAGTIPFTPITINPSSTQNFQFIIQRADDPSLLVSAADAASGAGIADASVTITNGGDIAETQITDHAIFGQTDWSTGDYAAENGGIETMVPRQLTLLANASGTYSTSTLGWLISKTFDVGGAASTFHAISWTPASQPAGAELKFQVAANNDNATWSFIGPDGTGATYFTVSSTLPASLAGNRYFRYKVYLNTQDSSATPTLDTVSFDFTANCVPPAQTLFTGLPQGTYAVSISAPEYLAATGTVAVGTNEATSTILMTHQ